MRSHFIPAPLKSAAIALLSLVSAPAFLRAQQPAPAATPVTADWSDVQIVSKSTPTLQVVVNPMLRPGSPIVAPSYAAVKALGADYVRYVPWLPYPRLAVAELEPPANGKTSWDFSLIDPMTIDFLNATEGHSTILNFSTIPAWLFKTPKPITYPADPNQVFWDYTRGSELRDPTYKELGDYYQRLVSWYTLGGFDDELGHHHTSGYHYSIPYWEVFNEIDFEHAPTPRQYTAEYDAVVTAIHKVSPQTKLVGLAMAIPGSTPDMFEYFLNPAHHAPGIPLDMISYHFYATPTASEDINTWQYTFFAQADGFLSTVRYIESIRKRLSPSTKTTIDELGVILPDTVPGKTPDEYARAIPPAYWNAAGSLFAYLYIELAKQGIDVVGESQLVGYPTQFPSVTMIDWTNGKPNARFWVLKLLKDNFGPGDKLVKTTAASPDLAAQAFLTAHGKKLLLLNKRNHAVTLTIPTEATGGKLTLVSPATGENPPTQSSISTPTITLEPFTVAVVTWP